MNSIGTTIPKFEGTWSTFATQWQQPSAFGIAQNQWEVRPGTMFAYYQDTIDMTAFTVQDKTFFPGSLEVIEPGIHLCGPNVGEWGAVPTMQVLDLVTSAPISNFDEVMDDMLEYNYPGGSQSTLDEQFIMYGRVQLMSFNNTGSYDGLMSIVSSQRFGSGKPTAADKLFVYRFLFTAGNFGGTGFPSNAATCQIPETRYTFVGTASTESDVARIYRIRQSYEQHQR